MKPVFTQSFFSKVYVCLPACPRMRLHGRCTLKRPALVGCHVVSCACFLIHAARISHNLHIFHLFLSCHVSSLARCCAPGGAAIARGHVPRTCGDFPAASAGRRSPPKCQYCCRDAHCRGPGFDHCTELLHFVAPSLRCWKQVG